MQQTNRERAITLQLEAKNIGLNEKLGQHFLIDEKIIEKLSSSVIIGAKVIEIGSGIGHITEALAKRAGSVIGIEIDQRFRPILEGIQNRNPRIRFIFGDSLRVRLESLIEREEETQVVASLPFHITEPFMHKLIDLPITNAVLVLGGSAVRELQEPETSMGFGKLSLLGQTFFDSRVLAQVPREAFNPQPRTDAFVMEFDPKDHKEREVNLANYIFAYLFRRSGKYGLVVNDMKQALVEASQRGSGSTLSKQESHRRDRSITKRDLRQMLDQYNISGDITVFQNHRDGKWAIISQSQALDVISKMDIPERILNKPFSRLDNQDVRDLTSRVRDFYIK